MGNSIFSRENARIEEMDPTSSNAYRFPPVKGSYFSSHYIMAGERFETFQPEAYLFGDNMDLNFLCSRPTPFPYPAPQPNEPTRTLRSLMNIRKESLRFVKTSEPSERDRTAEGEIGTSYNIEFTFDSDVRCGITIYYFCTEEVTATGVIYTPKHMSMNSETYHYKSGVNQQFSQTSHVFDPSKYCEEMLTYKFSEEIVPVLIQCVAEEGGEPKQSHALLAAVEKNADSTFTLKPLKQKIFVDGLYYVLQEVYGIENKNDVGERERAKDVSDDDVEDSGSECVICMSDSRDTLILPCRHLCLCNNCADSLRYAANNCPICRAPFRALLQIRAVRKTNNAASQVSHNAENQPSQDIPPGYEPVSLIEALNGPMQPSAPLVPAFVPPQVPSFTNSPDIRTKHRHLERSASLRHCENVNSDKDDQSSIKTQGASEGSSVPEVVASMMSSDKVLKSESLSLTRGEGRRHRKGFRTSSAPEKMRLLASSVQIVNEVGSVKRKIDKDAELAETKSLLEGTTATEEISGTSHTSPNTSRPCSRNSPISLSTPHSLHLCERSSKDTSPGGDDSDYYTPDDPSTTILVDQGTDTSLDTPQGIEMSHIGDPLGKNRNEYPLVGKHKINRERHTSVEEVPIPDGDLNILDKSKRNSDPLRKTESNPSHVKSPNCHSLVVNLDNPNSLPGTPASNVSNHSSGDSFSSTSSTRLLLCPQNCDTLPE